MSRRQSKTVNYNENSEDSGDYSVSEDDWEPNKKEIVTDSSDDMESPSVLIDDSLIDNIKMKFPKIKETKGTTTKERPIKRQTKKALSLSLRTKLYNKYKPPPKVMIKTVIKDNNSKCVVGGSTTTTTTTTTSAFYSKKTTIDKDQSKNSDCDSDSSVENYLVDPNKIDYTSSFFSDVKSIATTTTKSPSPPPPSAATNYNSSKPSTSKQIITASSNRTANEEKVPIFDCNAGMQLSSEDEEANDDDNDDDVEEEEEVDDENDFMAIDDNITNTMEVTTDNKSNNDTFNLSEFEEYTKKMELTKRQLETYKINSTNFSTNAADSDATTNTVVDISKLLAMGEKKSQNEAIDLKNTRKRKISTAISTSAKQTKRRQPPEQQQPIQSDSDWEDVEEGKIKTPTTTTRENVEVTVRPSTIIHKKSRRELDFEACLKRQINAEKRTNQLLCHKVHLLCLIAHGNFVNRILNNTELLAFTIKLLPSSNCYPNGETDIKYFESIAKWYKTRIGLKEQTTYCQLRNLPPLAMSLGIQIKAKNAICKKDYLLIFIILLRAMGIQCRLLLNFAITPMRPPNSELFNFSDKSASSAAATTNTTSVATTSAAATTTSLTKKTHEPLTKINLEKKSIAKPVVEVKNKIQSNTESKGNEKKPINKNDSKKSSTTSVNNLLDNGKTEQPTTSKIMSAREQKCTVQKKAKIINPSKSAIKDDDQQKINLLPSSNIKNKTIATMVESSSSPISHRTRKNVFKKLEKSTIKINDPNPTISKENIQKSTNNLNNNLSPPPPIHESPIFKNIKNNSKFHLSKSPISTRSKITQKLQSSIQISKDNEKEKMNNNVTVTKVTTKRILKSELKSIPQMDGNDDVNLKTKTLLRKSTTKKSKHSAIKNSASTNPPDQSSIDDDDDDDDDSDFQPSKQKKVQTIINTTNNNNNNKNKTINNSFKKNKIDTRILSTDNEEPSDKLKQKKQSGMDYWCEVYAEKEKRWITINLFTCKVDCVDEIRRSATQPMSYILAWNNDNTIKDVSARYCPLWNTVVRTNRVDKKWFNECIRSYVIRDKTIRDLAEDKELNKIHLDKPLPTAIQEFKNHPLYALKRHLLKFEAIYPENALTLGFIRGEAIYARECVHTLHSREIWVKQARVVRAKQKPYKIVKARPKWDRLTNSMLKPEPLEIFGLWQTQRYEPPTAENGVVPRNAYGNVELFKPEMLPKKTVHLQLPGLNRTCKKMNIDCAQAVIGFDFHSGSSHPTFDGFVICEEFAERAVEQWWLDQEEAERREKEKYEQRVYGNWKKLIKGLLIRQRLQNKYNFTGKDYDNNNKKSTFRLK